MRSKTQKIWMLLGLLSVGLWSCEKENLPLDPECVQVRVLNSICGIAVLEVVSPTGSDLGEDGWTDHEGNVHDNVFGTTFHCDDMAAIPADGSTFFVRLIDEPEPQNCIVCQALPASMPASRLNIRLADCNDSDE